MSIRIPSFAGLFVFLSLVSAVALFGSEPMVSQPQSSFQSSISGVLSWDKGGTFNGLQVELSERPGRPTIWTDVRLDGTFEIHTPVSMDPQYLLRVRNLRGKVVYEDNVRLHGSPLEIQLHSPERERPISGVVSVEELRNRVPKKAMREYQRAQKGAGKGDLQGAIRHLGKALEIDPQFAEAQNSLGVKYMLLQDYTHAAGAFQEAVRLRPNSSEPHSNLGVALHGLKRYDEAEREIRIALKIDPARTKTSYALAMVLAAQPSRYREALLIFAQIGDQIPEAHIFAAELLARCADSGAVVHELQAYLASREQKHRAAAQRWMRSLQSGTPLSGDLGMD